MMHEIYFYCRAIRDLDLKNEYESDDCDKVNIVVHVEKGSWILFKGYLGDHTFEPIAIANPADSTMMYDYQYTNEHDNIGSDESSVLNPKISLLWNREMKVAIPRGDVDTLRIYDEACEIDDVFYGLTWAMYN